MIRKRSLSQCYLLFFPHTSTKMPMNREPEFRQAVFDLRINYFHYTFHILSITCYFHNFYAFACSSHSVNMMAASFHYFALAANVDNIEFILAASYSGRWLPLYFDDTAYQGLQIDIGIIDSIDCFLNEYHTQCHIMRWWFRHFTPMQLFIRDYIILFHLATPRYILYTFIIRHRVMLP